MWRFGFPTFPARKRVFRSKRRFRWPTKVLQWQPQNLSHKSVLQDMAFSCKRLSYRFCMCKLCTCRASIYPREGVPVHEKRETCEYVCCALSRGFSVKSFPKHSLYRRKLCIQLHAGICCCARRAHDRDSNSLPGALLSYKSMRVLLCSPNPVWLKWAAVVSTSFPSICMSRGSRTLCTRKERHYNMCGRKMFEDENENNLEKKALMKALTNPLCRILSYANRYKCHFVHIHAHMLQLFRKSLAAMDRHDINPADTLKCT